jgi:uncharacterized protein
MANLLDVNLLVALFHPRHIHHEVAHSWFAEHVDEGWATCPITLNGACRVLSNPAAGLAGARVSEVATHLRHFCQSPRHQFWPASVSVLDESLFALEYLHGHKQITDAYLLGMAIRNGGRLVTFDRNIPIRAVRGATRDDVVLV